MTGPLATRSMRGLIPATPRSLFSLLDEMEQALRESFDVSGDGGQPVRVIPTMDLSETENEIQIRCDLPGIKPDDIDIELSGNTLTVRGQRKLEREEKGRTFHFVERREGTFARSVSLPCPVKEDEIDAQYHDGVLTVTVPKAEEAKTRKIQVKGS